jgi:uncharacterized protein YerC
MPQISKYPLHADVEDEMFRQFWTSISRLRSSSDVSEFFTDLLSATEQLMLAKRFTISILLLRGKKPNEIVSTLNVSYSTVHGVSSWLKNAKPRTRMLLQKMVKEKDWQRLLDKVDEVLDSLPPVYTRHWSNAYHKRRKRESKRQARQKI